MSKIFLYENLYVITGNIKAHRLKEYIYGLMERVKEIGTWKVGNVERANSQ